MAISKSVIRGLGGALLAEFIANIIAGGVKNLTAPGAGQPSPIGQAKDSRYTPTFAAVGDYERALYGENFRRLFNPLPLLDVPALVKTREDAIRLAMSESGAREYAKEQLKTQQNVATGLSGAVGTSASATGDVYEEAIKSYLARPNMEQSMAEIARAV